MATFYGSDTACVSDIGPTDLQITNPQRLISERIARRLSTPKGSLALIGGDPTWGFDLRQYVLGKMRTRDIAAIRDHVEAECLGDEQVESATAIVTISGSIMVVNIALESAVGPFSLTLNVSSLTVAMVFGS